MRQSATRWFAQCRILEVYTETAGLPSLVAPLPRPLSLRGHWPGRAGSAWLVAGTKRDPESCAAGGGDTLAKQMKLEPRPLPSWLPGADRNAVTESQGKREPLPCRPSDMRASRRDGGVIAGSRVEELPWLEYSRRRKSPVHYSCACNPLNTQLPHPIFRP